jgi:hypothetical protein
MDNISIFFKFGNTLLNILHCYFGFVERKQTFTWLLNLSLDINPICLWPYNLDIVLAINFKGIVYYN